MTPLSPFVAQQVGVILAMAPNRLAKRFKCSARQAGWAQQLMVLVLVKSLRRAKGQSVADLQPKTDTLLRQLASVQKGELAFLFASLLQPLGLQPPAAKSQAQTNQR